MKKMIVAMIATFGLAACGGGDDCDFNISSILNGSTGDNINSRWECNAEGAFATFAIFADGTGGAVVNNGAFELDAFTWEEVGCGEVDFQGFAVGGGAFSGTVDNLSGSINQGTLTLRITQEGVSTNVACTLIDV